MQSTPHGNGSCERQLIEPITIGVPSGVCITVHTTEYGISPRGGIKRQQPTPFTIELRRRRQQLAATPPRTSVQHSAMQLYDQHLQDLASQRYLERWLSLKENHTAQLVPRILVIQTAMQQARGSFADFGGMVAAASTGLSILAAQAKQQPTPSDSSFTSTTPSAQHGISLGVVAKPNITLLIDSGIELRHKDGDN